MKTKCNLGIQDQLLDQIKDTSRKTEEICIRSIDWLVVIDRC